jgi:serine/threonine protein phosphatase PrpC
LEANPNYKNGNY